MYGYVVKFTLVLHKGIRERSTTPAVILNPFVGRQFLRGSDSDRISRKEGISDLFFPCCWYFKALEVKPRLACDKMGFFVQLSPGARLSNYPNARARWHELF